MVATLGISVVFYAVMIVLAFLLVHIVPTPPYERHLDQLMLVCTNLIFMGIPIIQSFYGAEGVSLLSMFILLFNFLVFTYGVMMVGGSDIKLKQLCNPGVFSALLALFFGVTGLRLPAPVENTLSTIGAVNTPLAMMIIGASLAHSDILAAVSNPRLYRVSLLRLILIPLLMMGLVSVLPIDRMLAGICVIVSAMPIASNCGMLCDVYMPQDMTASHAIIISTLMSAVTLPVIVVLMGVVGLA